MMYVVNKETETGLAGGAKTMIRRQGQIFSLWKVRWKAECELSISAKW